MNNLTIASEYFESVVSKIHLTYLRKYSILQQADAYSYRLHQIVLDAIKYVHQQPNKPVFAEKLIAYLDVKNRLKDIQFFTLFHCNGDYVEKVYQDSNTSDAQKKVILYSQLQAENTFSDSEKFIEKLNKLVLNPVDSLYDCLLLVEKNEIELSATEKDKIEEQAKVMIANMNDVMKQTTNIEIRFELLHHIGKLYIKMRDLDNAKVIF